MSDLLALFAGLAVGVLAIVAVNGVRRGRPAPMVAPKAAKQPGPPPRPDQAPAASPAPPAEDHGIRVNHPGSAPPPAAAPPPPPPVIEPPAPPPAPSEAATMAAAAPDLAKRPEPAAAPTAPSDLRGRLDLDDGSGGVDLGDEPVGLGRGTDQGLRVKDSRASRHHAVVRRRSKGRPGWEVEDAGSANGTSLNGHTIPEGRVAPLRDGDRIGIGDTTVVYSEVAAAPPPAHPSPDDDATRIGP